MSAHKPSEILILSGATASGKSALAMELAATRPCVIINADAMQIYRPLRILTARPTPAEEAATPHALYGVLEASESSSVARWLALVVPTIHRVWAEGKLPLLVGGTGMYLKALMEGLAEVPEIPPEVRERVRESSKIHGSSDDPIIGSSSLHALLTEKDPIMAARLKPGDTQRILRALEVIEATGKSLDYFQRQPAALPLPEARFHLFMTELPRAEIYRRIDARFLQMMAHGALEEVREMVAGEALAQAGEKLYASHTTYHVLRITHHVSPLFKAHGVPELIAHLNGEMTLEAAIAKAQQNTRNYAKRQGTWLCNQFPEARSVASAKEIFASIDGSS
jgi:tRNA dimethylallyltransferase